MLHPFRGWKDTPASSHLLSAVYNVCLINHRFPDSWKKSSTILIHKSGDESLPSNWRPISLQQTVYKIFTAVIARRLAEWCIVEKKISNSQKGFLPMEGCVEHAFLMESIISDAKRRRKDLKILWLDLKNAFGAVSHDLLWLMMRRLGVPQEFTTICQEIFAGSTQRIRCAEGFTGEIPVNVGIKQGCPLSPLLFNIALESLLPILSESAEGYVMSSGVAIKQLAYADDICVTSSSRAEMSSLLEVIREFSEWSGLPLNIRKCGCLSMINSSSRGRYVETFSPKLGDQHIPALSWEDTYRYLGVDVGRPRSATPERLKDEILVMVDKILESRLTDWHKLDAINTFALSKATYALSTSILNRTWASKIDADIRRKVKKALRLPTRTMGAFYSHPSTAR